METDRSSKISIIRESYIRLVLNSIATLVAINLCGFVDNVIISRYLDTHALAAVGFFSPVLVVAGLPSVIILGSMMLCGNFIGSGRQDRVNALFTSAAYLITAFCLFFSVLLIAARSPLSSLLGAKDEAHRMLGEYIAGFAPGIVFSSLSAMMMALASFNNEINRSYVATAVMFFGNLLLDVLLAGPLGIFGIGLASTLSSLASFLVLLPCYLKKGKTIHLERGSFDPGLLIQAAGRGLPVLLFTAGMLVKNSLINYTLNTCIGYAGIAVANVLGSVCGIAGTVAVGCTNAFSGLASLYYGEEDREGLTDTFRFALRIGIVCTALLAAALMIFSRPLAEFFFQDDSGARELGRNMFLLGFIYFPVNLVINLLMNGYKIQGRMLLVNLVSFAEVSVTGAVACITAPRFGPDAVWLANTWSDLLALAVLLLSVFVWRKGVSLKIRDLLKLPDDFGAGRDESAEFAVSAPPELSAVSQAIIEFCRQNGTGERKAFYAGLCTEEVAGNILEHGGFRAGRGHVNIRIVCKKELTIRIQDDCRKFDPRERMNMHHPDRPEENIGLRMVAGMATSVDYYNNAGINTLILKF